MPHLKPVLFFVVGGVLCLGGGFLWFFGRSEFFSRSSSRALGRRPPPPKKRRPLFLFQKLTRGAPVDKLDRALGLDGRHARVDVLGHHVAAVHQAARHVLAVARVALGHHGGRLEGRVGDLGDGELFGWGCCGFGGLVLVGCGFVL
jgi:hypothetical protein